MFIMLLYVYMNVFVEVNIYVYWFACIHTLIKFISNVSN